MGPKCWRLLAGLPVCPATWPGSVVGWCPACRGALEEAPVDELAAWDESFPGAPCPLDAHQVEAYADWLASGDRPAWSWEMVLRPSAN